MASSSSPFLLLLLLLLHTTLATAAALSFFFPSFNSSTEQFIAFQNDTFLNAGISLTKDQYQSDISGSVGRAYYNKPLSLRGSAAFATHFSFSIKSFNNSFPGDGMAFFLSPFPSLVPPGSAGGSIGLVELRNSLNASANRIVAVEFDTYKNDWDPSAGHLGIDLNSMRSNATLIWNTSINDGRTGNAWITYNATTTNLTVFLTFDENPVFAGNSSLHCLVNLTEILPDEVAVGFSASTGLGVETHTILSWDFSSTPIDPGERKKSGGLIVGLAVGAVLLLAAAAGLVFWFFVWRRKKRGGEEEEEEKEEIDEGEFEKGRGPKKFAFRELAAATRSFDDGLKLGQGGFGGVYRGFLAGMNVDVAIKRVSKGSQQGKKEYVSEVKIVSRLRHRNLVQLVGWCHEMKELLLVYEFMPNGSLDSFLYTRDNQRFLPWPLR